jgi:hypothetical protein
MEILELNTSTAYISLHQRCFRYEANLRDVMVLYLQSNPDANFTDCGT